MQGLKVLREAGLITGERRGTWIYYRVRPDLLAQVSAVLVPRRPMVRWSLCAAPGRLVTRGYHVWRLPVIFGFGTMQHDKSVSIPPTADSTERTNRQVE